MWTTAYSHPHSYGLDIRASWPRRLQHAGVWLGETICGIRGHDLLMHFEPLRICLRCSTCGHETPGWQIGPPVRHFRPVSSPAHLVSPLLSSTRSAS